ncbi:type II toxin-antitoxin system HicB family antitoxin [Methylobacterium sp. WSM2598]|uniref:type II toxin-antitoxin system HicB family antitoxin n=1 Tax=Methylobacterium sp. WSM2598 TaxID=398261 RepID=UPI0003736C02|nr:hypothetical protein [Methylobacterium sp. WSM2598]
MEHGWIYGYVVRQEEGAFHAYSSAAPDAVAWGETYDDAMRQMEQGLVAVVEGRMKFGLDLSPPAPPAADEPERFLLPASVAVKAAVYAAWKASGLSKVALAARLGCAEKEVRRILDPYYPTGLARMEQAARALGVALVIGARPAPTAEAA